MSLKKRLIACLVVNEGIVVQSLYFKHYLPVGSVSVAVEFLNNWGIDEIFLLTIDTTKQGKKPDLELIKNASRKCFVPLSVGGGIKSISDIKNVIHAGADKVSINNAAICNPGLIKKGASIFGSQCIVISIDIKKTHKGEYEVYFNSGQNATGLEPVAFAREVEKLGAGEILLNAIDRDGSQKGYDLELIEMVSNAVKIPVIACGGVGHPKHFMEALKIRNVSAVAASNYFHFTEHSVNTAKSYLQNGDIDIRLDTYANYKDYDFIDGRIAKKSDDSLEELLFKHFPKEVV